MNPDILLTDINGLGYAAMYTPQGALQHNGFPTGGIHGGINSLFTRMLAIPGAMPVVVWDSKCHWRLEIYEDYKVDRKGTPERDAIRLSYNKQLPIMQLLLTAMGIPQVVCPNAEADDLAGVLMRNLDHSWLIEMFTRDTDWIQALDARSTWHSPVHKKLLNMADLRNPDPAVTIKDGPFDSAKEYLMCKALAGDTSDCIVGIEKVGLATARKIVRAHGGDIQNFWDAVDAGTVKPSGVVMTRVANAESRAIYARNLSIMDWARGPKHNHRQLVLSAAKPDFDEARYICADLGLEKLANIMEKRLTPWLKSGWGPALSAVDAALNYHICQPVCKPLPAFNDEDLI